jgi:hypothetical protein
MLGRNLRPGETDLLALFRTTGWVVTGVSIAALLFALGFFVRRIKAVAGPMPCGPDPGAARTG